MQRFLKSFSLILILGLISAVSVCASDMPGGEAQHEESPRLAILAGKPYRPAWAPIPVLRDKSAWAPTLHRLLKSPDSVTRARSAFLLGQIGSRTSIKPLADKLNDPSPAVRTQVGIALACIGDTRGLKACANALETHASWIRYYAAYGLWNINTSQAKEVLKTHANGQDALTMQAIEGALNTPYIAPPAPDPIREKNAKAFSANGIWAEAAVMLAGESDWWWHKGDYDQAIRCHEAGLLMDPHNVEGYSLIAWLQWSLGRGPVAVRTLKRCVAANPSDPNAYYELGNHYFITKKYALAEEPLRKSVSLGGDNLARRSYAHCLEKLGKLDEALAQWAAIVKANPKDGAARVNLNRVRKLID